MIEAKTITSLSSTPTAPAGTGPYQIVGAVVRKKNYLKRLVMVLF